MKRRLKLFYVVLITITAMMYLCGCWDSRELNTLGIVMGVGLDKAESPDQIEMTVQISHANGEQSGSNSSSNAKKQNGGKSYYFNAKEVGKDVLSVLQKYTLTLSRKLYFAHNKIIIFGEDLAKEGVRDSFDFFSRYNETRMTVYVFVARGKAEDVLDTEINFEEIPASEIFSLMHDPIGSIEKPSVFADEFTLKLISETTSAVAPIIEVREDEGEKHFYITGCAVFKGDKLVGELNEKESSGYQWVEGKIRSSKFYVGVNGEYANIFITTEKSKVTPVIRDDKTVMVKVEINAQGSLISQSGNINFADPVNIELLEKNAERMIKQDVENTINKTRDLGTDIFGFGESLYRKYPKEWKDLEQQWDEIYKNIEVQVDVTVKVNGSGKIVRPLYPEKE